MECSAGSWAAPRPASPRHAVSLPALCSGGPGGAVPRGGCHEGGANSMVGRADAYPRPQRAAVARLQLLLCAAMLATSRGPSTGATASVARPTAQQLALLQHPVSAMAHFGISTFAGEDNPCNAKGCPPVTLFRPLLRPPATCCDVHQWVTAARALGSRQICLTAHHGAGFTLWDSALTNYSAAHSPYGADLLVQFASECRRQNVSICYYWDSGDAFDATAGAAPETLFAKQRGWLHEVLSNPVYGPVDRLWIDGWSDSADSFWGSRGVGTRLVRALSPRSLLVPGPDGCHAVPRPRPAVAVLGVHDGRSGERFATKHLRSLVAHARRQRARRHLGPEGGRAQ